MKKIIVKFTLIGLAVLAVVVSAAGFWIMHVLASLPDVSSLKHYRPPAATEVLYRNGEIVTSYYDGRFRIWIPIADVPSVLIQAVVIAEDDSFFEHKGVNYKATREALVHDLRKRRFARGGSTITQQMIKNVFLSKEKTISRKIREYVLAKRAEEILSKLQILQIYLNEVEWGENIYGVEAASRYYFDKHTADLTASEAALLAGMLPNPKYYNPFKRMDKARKRQERVLFNMQQAKVLTREEYDVALTTPIKLRQERAANLYFSAQTNRPCSQRVLEQILVSILGEHDLYRAGKTVKTTLDKSLQNDLNRWSDTKQSKETEGYHKAIAVLQNGQIRGLVCENHNEDEVRGAVGSVSSFFNGYEVSAISVSSITREQIIVLPDAK